MKIYIAHYNNGEAWEDFYEWYSKKAYINKEDCLKEILEDGFIIDEEDHRSDGRITYKRESNDGYFYQCDFVIIEELELVE